MSHMHRRRFCRWLWQHESAHPFFIYQSTLRVPRREFVEAVRLEPRLALAHSNLGLVLRSSGKPTKRSASFD